MLQTEVMYSITEAQYYSLSSALCDIIPMMQLVEEIKPRRFFALYKLSHVYCKAFQLSSGGLELARLPNKRSCTDQIAACYHHFRVHFYHGKVKIFPTNKPMISLQTLLQRE